jgi:uncharacterized membrane protein
MMTDVNRATTPAASEKNGARRDVVVGSYDTHRQATDAVELLKNLRIPDQYRSVVPRDIVMVETGGGMNLGKAVLYGASAGAVIGLLLGLFSGSFDWMTPPVAHVWVATIGVVCGAVFGALTGALAHWAAHDSGSGQKRERFEAGRYDVVTDEANAEEARRVLRESVGARA